MPRAEQAEELLPVGASAGVSGKRQGNAAPTRGARLDEEDDDLGFSKSEGFEVMVFLPQLVVRLFPPLMLLQLVPDFHPRVDHLVLAAGTSLVLFGQFTWQSWALGAGAFVSIMALPASLRTVWKPRCHHMERPDGSADVEGYGKSSKAKLVCFFAGIAAMCWDYIQNHAKRRFRKVWWQFKLDPYDSTTFAIGMILVLCITLVWLDWTCDWARKRYNSELSGTLWLKPRFTGLDWPFVERFPLGEFCLTRGTNGVSIKRKDEAVDWSVKVELGVARELFKGAQLQRFQQLCEETEPGLLAPSHVEKVVKLGSERSENMDMCCAQWERYDRTKHGSLRVEVSYDPASRQLGLTLPDRTSSLFAQGGNYATGYRVLIVGGAARDPVNPSGDYHHSLDYVNSVTSISPTSGRPKPLEFTEEFSKRKLVHQGSQWIIARPKQRSTVSSEGNMYDPSKFEEHDFQGEDQPRIGPQAAHPTVQRENGYVHLT